MVAVINVLDYLIESFMSVDYRRTLCSLEAYELLSQLPSVRNGDDEIIFQCVEGADGKTAIDLRLRSWTTFCERVWGKTARFEDIQQIAQASIEAGIGAVSEFSKHRISLAVEALNAGIKILSANQVQLSLVGHVPQARVHIPVRGLQNPFNKCYVNSTITALCASHRFQDLMLSRPHLSDVGIYLQLVFHALQTEGRALSHYTQPVRGFISSMAPFFPSIRPTISMAKFLIGNGGFTGFSQQDAAEFLQVVLSRTIDSGQVVFREIVERVSTESISHSSAFIPAVDGGRATNARPESTTILSITFEELAGLPLEMYFHGIEDRERLQASALIAYHRDEAARGPLIERQRYGGSQIPDIRVRRRRVFLQSPKFLPIQIVRFITVPICNDSGVVQSSEKGKISEPIDVPFHLHIPVEASAPVRLILRGVIAHIGEDMDSGHYVSYVPDPTSLLTADGMPSSWTFYNDGDDVNVVTWAQIRDNVRRCCHILLYDEE